MMMKKIILFVIVVLVGVGIYTYQQTQTPPRDVLYGNVDIRQVSLAFEGSGRIVEMYAQEGVRVHKGDLLASIDATSLKLQREALLAQVELAQKLAARLQGLAKVSAASQQDLDNALAQEKVALANIALLDHQIKEAQLLAPVDGVIREQLLQVGDMVSPSRTVYVIGIDNPKRVRAYVDEIQLGQIKPNQAVKLYIDSQPDKAIDGHIAYISSMAEFTPKTVQTPELRTSLMYEIQIRVSDPDNVLRAGMPTTIHLAGE